jgi:hypothetical protein
MIFRSILLISSWSFGIILFVFVTLAELPFPSNLNPDHTQLGRLTNHCHQGTFSRPGRLASQQFRFSEFNAESY